MTQHPKTWWFKLAEKLFPGRCREVPEATDPDRVLIRQFAIIKKHVYLQQFASGENPEWFHSHPYSLGTIAIGLWGSVYDVKYAGRSKEYRAPYFRYMDRDHIHQTIFPSSGHTSLFIGIGRKTDDKYYFNIGCHKDAPHWSEHIQRKVKRI